MQEKLTIYKLCPEKPVSLQLDSYGTVEKKINLKTNIEN